MFHARYTRKERRAHTLAAVITPFEITAIALINGRACIQLGDSSQNWGLPRRQCVPGRRGPRFKREMMEDSDASVSCFPRWFRPRARLVNCGYTRIATVSHVYLHIWRSFILIQRFILARWNYRIDDSLHFYTRIRNFVLINIRVSEF